MPQTVEPLAPSSLPPLPPGVEATPTTLPVAQAQSASSSVTLMIPRTAVLIPQVTDAPR